MTFINLHNHTTYSLMQSIIKPADLFAKCKELGQPAVAVTDLGTLAGAHDALKYSLESGIKLIMGLDAYFCDDLSNQDARLRHIVLLAKNATGYKNLLLLNKVGYDNNIINFKKVFPRIDWNILEQYSEGVICLTGDGGGILSQLINAKDISGAKEQALKLKKIFGDNLGIEVLPNVLVRNENSYSYKIDQNYTNRQLIKIAQELDIKLVAASNSYYLTKDQAAAQDVLLAIGSGQPISSGGRLKYNVPDFYVKEEHEIMHFFSRAGYEKFGKEEDKSDFASMLCANTVYFADQCEVPNWIDPKFSNPSGKELPSFPIEDQPDYQEFLSWLPNQTPEVITLPSDAAYLRFACDKRFAAKVPVGQEDIYRARLAEEFDVMEFHGFCSYMLIVADYLEYSERNNIRIGPGRGSVGGSLIAYLLGIHKADPIKYKLIFARFHNKEKKAYPDIDSDFAPSGRDKVHEYIRNKYGSERVAHVSNVMTISPKVYARDMARAFEFGGSRKKAVLVGTNIADSIPNEVHSIPSALLHSPLFAEFAKQYPELSKYADTVAGKARAWATHAGGIIIAKRPLAGLIPLRKDKDGSVAIEYEKERAEANGLVKMDTLGLSTLDILDTTYDLIKAAGKEAPPDPPDYSIYDKKTYDLISSGNTFCVFQLGTSGGTIDLCKKLKPKSIEDLAAITTLARPAAKDIREPYIKTKNGEETFELLHPNLERAFKDTYGFALYEECLLYLAQDVAGWDMNQADRLRKLTKDKGKNPEKIIQWRLEFIADAQKNKGISEKIATQIWDDIVAKFGGYAFNLSHAALYSFVSYHTAYLKAHFPVEFLVANLMSEVGSTAKQSKDNIIKIKDEIRNLKVKIIPPDLNTSGLTYKLIGDNTLMTGLDALKFMGKDAIPEILAKRPFKNFEDFLTRVDGKLVRAPAIQALAASGSLDSFGLSRKLMFLYAGDYKKKLQVWSKKAESKRGEFNYPWPTDIGEWSIREKYALEQFYLGEGLSGTLKERFPGFFDGKIITFNRLPELYPEVDENTGYKDRPFIDELRGEIRMAFKFKVKKEGSKIFGKMMQRLQLRDHLGNELSVVIFPDTLEKIEDYLRSTSGKKIELSPGMVIKFSGQISKYEGELSVSLDDIFDFKLTPPLPENLESQKVTIPRTKKKIDLKENLDIDQDELLEEVEDEIINEGMSEDEEFTDSFE